MVGFSFLSLNFLFIDLNIHEKNGKNMLKYQIMSNELINYDLKMPFGHK